MRVERPRRAVPRSSRPGWVLGLVIGLHLWSPTAAGTTPWSNTTWGAVADRHGLDPSVLYAVALLESARAASRATVHPWPWVIRGPDGPQFFDSSEHAQRELSRLVEITDRRALDVGLMQVNLHWHGHRVAEPAQLLDPQINLQIAASILAECVRSAPRDLELAIGRYHSWREEAARAYGRRALALARALKRFP